MENIDTIKRQELRIQIIKELCLKLNFLTINSLEFYDLEHKFSDIDGKDLIGAIVYLKEKKYLDYSCPRGDPDKIFLTVKGIDLIETLETDMPINKYERDFSTKALQNVKNM